MRALLLLFCLCALVISTRAADWVVYPVAGVQILTHPGQDKLARRIGDIVAGEMPRLAAAIGVQHPGPFPIYAYASRPEFAHDAGIDPLLVGLSYSPSGKILLDASGKLGPIRQTLTHEMTHSLLNQRLGDNIGELPSWVNEGIAGHLSEPISPAQLPGVSRMIYQGHLLTLDQLEEAFSMGENRDAAYLQSRSMIAWLEYRRKGSLLRLIDGLAGGDSFAIALHNAAGLTQHEWWQQWQESIPAFIYWLTFLGSPLIYAPLAILFVIVVIIRLRRRDAAEDEEDDEDDEDDEEDDESNDAAPA